MVNNKNKLVFVGGFGGGKSSAEEVGEKLGKHLNVNDVETFTFSRARKNPEELMGKMREARHAASHSAGALELVGSEQPAEFMFFNAPTTPNTKLRLVARGLIIAYNMQRDAMKNRELLLPTTKFSGGYIAELLAHLPANIKPLLSGEIPEFDSRKILSATSRQGMPVTNVQTLGDEYFSPDSGNLGLTATQGGYQNIITAGGHNRLLVDTDNMLDEVFFHI